MKHGKMMLKPRYLLKRTAESTFRVKKEKKKRHLQLLNETAKLNEKAEFAVVGSRSG
jgi:hypothetical protein